MKLKKLALLIAAAGLSTTALATNGYFAHGYGMKAKGMGGVGIALPQDALAAATNPAGMVMVGNRVDLGVEWFRPVRDSEISGNLGPINGNYDGNDTQNFLVPEFGYNRMINPNLSLGVSVYGNGGMNSDYKDGIPLFGVSGAGVNLSQLFIAPTVAFKIAPDHAVGVSLNLAHQRFRADGLQNFNNGAFSSSVGNVTNNGTDTSNGYGIRVGYTGKLSDMVTVGATYQSKTRMSKFSNYKGLFAEDGDFDIPENYGAGIAVKATQALTVAFDVVQINYSDVKSIANPLSNLTVLGNPLGSKNGPGFGWKDMTAYKLGVSYELSKDLTMRAGYNYGKQPIPSSETMFNILAPGVVEHHLTLGATWTLSNKDEITVMYMHAFENKVKGVNSIPLGFGGGNANLKMYQDSLGVAYSWKM